MANEFEKVCINIYISLVIKQIIYLNFTFVGVMWKLNINIISISFKKHLKVYIFILGPYEFRNKLIKSKGKMKRGRTELTCFRELILSLIHHLVFLFSLCCKAQFSKLHFRVLPALPTKSHSEYYLHRSEWTCSMEEKGSPELWSVFHLKEGHLIIYSCRETKIIFKNTFLGKTWHGNWLAFFFWING